MGGGKEDRIKAPDFVEVESPEFLEPDQNFFDQGPFREIITKSASMHDADETILRTLLHYYADYYPTPHYSHSYGLMSPALISRNSALTLIRKGSWGRRINWLRGEKQKYMGAVTECVDNLEPFPRWQKYVHEMCVREEFKTDGVPKNRHFPTETYPKWYFLQIEAEKKSREIQTRQVVHGIEEVFPQDFSEELIVPDLSTHSQKPGTRKWRILITTNLASERKNKTVKSN